MNTTFVIFFGVIALVLGLFVALLFISALSRGAESMSEAMAMNPPKFMGASFAGLAIFYLTNIGLLRLIGTSENDPFQDINQLIMMNGYGGYVGIGVLVFGVVLYVIGYKLEEKMKD